ncbi:DOPA 4,5-dioxygenase family protein [Marinobacter sp. X15-166B]|uniref:DOPA 4,5-dioxygenase family protein n=1 Tax=Marinobacter sp. X15-166B TaxID=1897620 RepID=UPI00085BDAB1|nr:DOPA 4,5-dioxygenase family protein [Marinobacter sp. X15-166B]OEY65423.1 4,5-dioxygenase [Marinobacter sp. X15-166B]
MNEPSSNNEPRRPVNTHKAYHAHVYFEQETLEFARQLCTEAGERFNLRVGRFHEKPVGPHPKWSCQISFGTADFDQLVPWLDEHRQGLSILIHGLTGNDLEDHTRYAYFLGDPVELDVSMFAAQ